MAERGSNDDYRHEISCSYEDLPRFQGVAGAAFGEPPQSSLPARRAWRKRLLITGVVGAIVGLPFLPRPVWENDVFRAVFGTVAGLGLVVCYFMARGAVDEFFAEEQQAKEERRRKHSGN